jgi:uncharacterized membrane protein YqhA
MRFGGRSLARFLAACRFLLVVPVLGCVVLTAGAVLMGFGRIITAGAKLIAGRDFSPKAAKTTSLALIEIISLSDLEDKIIGVVIAALAVAFLGQAANTEDPYALLNYGGGIAFVIVALAFFMRQNAKPRKEEDGQRTSQS